MNYIGRVFRYVLPYRGLAVLTVIGIAISSLLGLVSTYLMTKILVDNVFGVQGRAVKAELEAHAAGKAQAWPWFLEKFFDHDAAKLLVFVVIASVVLVLAEHLMHVFNDYLQTKLEQRIMLDFRSDLFEHAQQLSLAFHDRSRSGMLIFTINSQAGAAVGLIMSIPPLASSALTLVLMFWVAMKMDWELALLSLAVVPFLYYSVHYYATHIQDRLMKVRMMEGESLSIIHEAISMLRVTVAFGREDYQFRRFRKQGEATVEQRVNLTVRQKMFSLAVGLITGVGSAMVLWVGGSHVFAGKLTAGSLLFFLGCIAKIYQPLEAISYTVGSLQEKFISLRMAFKLLDNVPEIKDVPEALTIERAAGAIAFENVNFSYTGRVDTLKNINFNVDAGQVVAVVGPTGAGKTTLISLLPRFYANQSGRILLDGTDIRDLSLRSLRQQISVVLQEPLLFSGSIVDNIKYGRLEATMDEVIAAAKAANAHDFIMNLPKQYETDLGERGAQLSGGERQRVCVARAFLKDAPILILDEPTSAIDSKTEAVILDALDRLMVGRTTFMIAHRLSTVRKADKILVMERGRLVGVGTHSELIAKGGLYRQLYDLQMARRTTKEKETEIPESAGQAQGGKR